MRQAIVVCVDKMYGPGFEIIQKYQPDIDAWSIKKVEVLIDKNKRRILDDTIVTKTIDQKQQFLKNLLVKIDDQLLILGTVFEI